MRRTAFLAGLLLAALAAAPAAREHANDARLKKAFRKPADNGWIFVHLEGMPGVIGFQHGYLLAPEIADAHRAVKVAITDGSKEWSFFRDAAGKGRWARIAP